MLLTENDNKKKYDNGCTIADGGLINLEPLCLQIKAGNTT